MILFHIVGINNNDKFISKLNEINEMNVEIIDIDKITKNIIANCKIHDINKLYIKWKNIVMTEINKIIETTKNKHTILLGHTIFYGMPSIKIDTEIKNKILVKNDNLNVMNKMYPDFIIKSYEDILHDIKNIKIVYVASLKRHDNELKFISDTVIGYSEKWLAIMSIFSRNKFGRGIAMKNNVKVPFVKELVPCCIGELDKSCYVYEVISFENIDNYRYLVKETKIIKRYYVSNIRLELELNNTIFDKYKTT